VTSEPPTAEQPKPETPQAEKTWRDQEPPANLTKNAKESWHSFKSKAQADVEARDARIKVLETDLSDAKKIVPTSQAEIERLKAELAQAQAIVERVAVERSPLFKSKVTDQEDLIRARLAKIVEGTGVTAAEAQALMTGDLNAREAVLENRPLTTMRKSQIADLLNRWDQVQEERTRITSNGRESMTAFFAEQQRAEESRRAEFMRESVKIFEDQESLCTPKLEPYQRIEGNEDWNRNTVVLRQAARRIYDGSVDRATLAQVAILAPAAVVYQKLFQGAQKRIADLEATVDKLRGVAPTVRDTRPDAVTPGTPPPTSSPNGDFVKDLVNKFSKATGLQ
jgi:archaellum component FlaC